MLVAVPHDGQHVLSLGRLLVLALPHQVVALVDEQPLAPPRGAEPRGTTAAHPASPAVLPAVYKNNMYNKNPKGLKQMSNLILRHHCPHFTQINQYEFSIGIRVMFLTPEARVFGSFGYANMSLYDRHLSLVSLLLLLVSASVDSSLKV